MQPINNIYTAHAFILPLFFHFVYGRHINYNWRTMQFVSMTTNHNCSTISSSFSNRINCHLPKINKTKTKSKTIIFFLMQRNKWLYRHFICNNMNFIYVDKEKRKHQDEKYIKTFLVSISNYFHIYRSHYLRYQWTKTELGQYSQSLQKTSKSNSHFSSCMFSIGSNARRNHSNQMIFKF